MEAGVEMARIDEKWQVDDGEGLVIWNNKEGEERTIIAVAVRSKDVDAKANARLIATTPEMYRILKGISDIMSESNGVAGWHLNGDVAVWDAFEEFRSIPEILERIRGS